MTLKLEVIEPAQEPVKKPRKHAELIKAWADGAGIEVHNHIKDEWQVDADPIWNENSKYRIYQEPKPDVVRIFKLESHPLAGLRFTDITGLPNEIEPTQNIKVIWDGETGDLKGSEVLK